MQHVVTICILTIAGQFVEAGYAVHIRTDTVFVSQDLTGTTYVVQNRTTTHQLNLAFRTGVRFQFVDTFTDTFFNTGRHCRVMIVFVQRSDVVVDIFRIVAVHTTQTVLNNDRYFIHE